jgi:hypothetical protein
MSVLAGNRNGGWMNSIKAVEIPEMSKLGGSVPRLHNFWNEIRGD